MLERWPGGTRRSAYAARRRPTAIWFADDSFTQAVAKAICRGCPVREKCLAAALAADGDGARFGMRGGLTARERRSTVSV